MTVEEWKAEYTLLSNNPPEDGDFLRTKNGGPIRLDLILEEGKTPFIFTRIYLPSTVGTELEWFVRGRDDASNYGWKGILIVKSRIEAIKRYPDLPETINVKSVQVVRKSKSNKSYLLQVVEW